ncbi:MAG TPA: TRAM domain-containing protein [Vicinamibacterales bacterium]|nr:TRAM domain-containing protein [Vicinamibacterales bacterium]
MLETGQQISLTIDRPAHGGRMIGRHEGQVVLVRGAIPGERVMASIERVERRLAFGTVVGVLEPSPDRRPGQRDPRCGGCLFSHIAYPRQLTIKSEIAVDAFSRLGRVPLEAPVAVAASPEHGYRMRARFHVRGGRAGFYREGTHEICDAGPTGQLTTAAVAAAESAVASLREDGLEPLGLELTENLEGSARVAAIELTGEVPCDSAVRHVLDRSGLAGCTVRCADREAAVAGTPAVSDELGALTRGRAGGGTLSRHAESFFQANRYLLPDLAAAVLDAVPDAGEVLDLYAGVGLFSVSLAGAGRRRITAVEGDRSSGADLRRNAAQFGRVIRVVLRAVEDYLRSLSRPLDGTLIVDPPRTGISKEAMQAALRIRASRVVYVSCDPATMARDARRLLDAGYVLQSLRGFDLFPNTPHVELLGVFVRG